MKKIFSLFAAVLFAGSMMADNYVLVTDASTLAAGDQIIITDTLGAKALGTTQNTNNRAAVAVSDDNGVIVPGANVQIITLEASGNNWMLKVGDDQYLYAASSSANQLKTASAETAGDNGKFAITIDAKNFAAVEAQGNNRPSMRYNSQSSLFACYSATSSVVAGLKIYKKSNVEVFGYYLVGTMTEWKAAEAYKMTPNNGAEYVEYMLDITLTAGNQEMKVAYSNGKTIEDTNWFPTGMGNNFVINNAGDYTIYFRPDGQGGEGWHYGYIYAEYHEPLVVTNCATARQAAMTLSANNEIYKEGEKDVFTIRGYVTSTPEYNDTYHNVTFWIADEADGGQVFEVYRATCASAADAPELGDYVEATGKITRYNSTPEFAAGCTYTILADPTNIDNVAPEQKAIKTFENGQLVIIKNGIRYDVTGAVMR